MKTLFLVAVIALLSLAYAQSDEFAIAKQLVDSNAACNTLSDTQLELIVDYLMEQMHPGAAHERMDAMMGGEGSESLKRVHIQIAQAIYCGKTDTPLTYGGMMGRGISGSGFGMMSAPYGIFGWSIFDILLLLLLAGLIAIVYLHLFQQLSLARHRK